MKIFKTWVITLISSVFLVLLSCKKPDRPYYPFDSSFTDYVSYPTKSYWVYADSVTSEIADSIILERQIISSIKTPSHESYGFDVLDQSFKRYKHGLTDSVFSFGASSEIDHDKSMEQAKGIYQYYFGGGPKYPRKAFLNASVSSAIVNPVRTKYLGNVNVTGQKVDKAVYEITCNDPNNGATVWYMAKGVGLIKFKSNNQTYILIDSNL